MSRLAVLVLAGSGAWVAGRASARGNQGTASAPAVGYDLGVAGKPRPTGQLREFQLVAKEATWELAPGVAVPAISYNGQVPGPTIRCHQPGLPVIGCVLATY